MMVLDASALIAYLDGEDAHHVAALELLEEAEDDLGANVITWAEVLVGPARLGRVAEVEAVFGDIGLAELEWPAGAPRRLAELRASTSLRLPDCCVLLSAQEAARGGPAVLATFDSRLARAAGDLGLTARPSL